MEMLVNIVLKTAVTELDDNYANLVDDDFVTWPPFQLQISQVTDPIHAVAPKVLFTASVSKQQAIEKPYILQE